MSKLFSALMDQKVDDNTPFEEIFAKTKFVHFFFITSALIYVLLASQLQQYVFEPGSGFVTLPSTEYMLLLGVLVVAAFVCAAIVLLVLPKRNTVEFLVEKRNVKSLNQLGLGLREEHLRRVIFCNTIAIFGLVLFLLNGNIFHLIPFVAVSILLLILIYPRWANWEAAKNKLQMLELGGSGQSLIS